MQALSENEGRSNAMPVYNRISLIYLFLKFLKEIIDRKFHENSIHIKKYDILSQKLTKFLIIFS